MTYENFCRLTGATLVNTPCINAFIKVELHPNKIQQGDLFIGDKDEDITLALENEAYGILTEKKVTITDDEIAWLRCENIEEILVRLLRFTLLEKEFRFIYLEDIELQLLRDIAEKEHLYFLDEDQKNSYKKIINADKHSIFFCSQKDFLTKIYPDFERLKKSERLFDNIKSSLFTTDFTYKERAFVHIKLSSLFLHNLERVTLFLEENQILYDFEKCHYNKHFHPLFVNQKLQLKPFGKSDKVIICESDEEMVEKEMAYLREHAKWAKIIFLKEDIERLKNIEFNFAIIVTEYATLKAELEKNQSIQQKLF